jgi:cation diffusion facilitator family transporter
VKLGRAFTFPPEQQAARQKARRLSWATILFLLTAATFLAITLGQSQAMKTAWVSDVLSIIPPIAILVAMRLEEKKPGKRFPFGYFRAISVAFLATAAVLMLIGLWLFFDSVMKLASGHRPPVGGAELFGHALGFWAGWLMMAALAYSMSGAIVVGQLKRPVAETLKDKMLMADAEMNRAEWMSEGAAIVGILLIGLGFWWGDAATAAFISIGIVRDGWHQLRQVLGDLMDEAPTKLGGKELEDLPAKIKDAAERLPWVRQAAVRLREHGHVLSGEVFVVPRDGTDDLVTRADDASEALLEMDWRLYSLPVILTADLEDGEHPRD